MNPDPNYVKLHITNPGSMGESVWARRTEGPGVYELENFPGVSEVDYTSGDLVYATPVPQDGYVSLEITGLAQQRYWGTWLKYGAPMIEQPETRREFRAHLEAAGCRLEWLVEGWCGIAVPLALTQDDFNVLLEAAPYASSLLPIEDDEDDEER